MLQPPKSHLHFDWFPPLWVFGLLCASIVAVNLAAELLELATGISDNTIDVLAIPIWEEMLKLWLVLKLFDKAFGAIITFGVMELIFVKGPFFFETPQLGELPAIAVSALIALAFHVATAFAYRWTFGSRGSWYIFGVCAVCHILFNLLSTLDLNVGSWGLGAVLISAVVLFAGKLSARITSPNEGY